MRHRDVITTDTATICIFDLAAMRHRKDDTGDWWSIQADAVLEARAGNALFLDVGDDGSYEVEIAEGLAAEGVGYCLNAPSGKIFVGPGEEMSGAEFEPTGEWGGFFVDLQPGHYRVAITRDEQAIVITVQATTAFENELSESIRI